MPIDDNNNGRITWQPMYIDTEGYLPPITTRIDNINDLIDSLSWGGIATTNSANITAINNLSNGGVREAQTINRHITQCACCGEEVESEVAYCVCEKCRQVIRRIRRKQNGAALNDR